MRRALNEKCPKLALWAADERTSVLVLEANDIQLSNVFVAYAAFKQALAERTDKPTLSCSSRRTAARCMAGCPRKAKPSATPCRCPIGIGATPKGRFGRADATSYDADWFCATFLRISAGVPAYALRAIGASGALPPN